MRSSVRDIARGKWPGILTQLGIDKSFLRNVHGPCPICGGTDRWRFDDNEGSGSYYCSGCGSGDGVRLVMNFKNLDFRNAAIQIEQAAGFVKPGQYQEKKSDEEIRRRLNKLWAGSRPVILGDPVMEYFEKRGISIDHIPHALRYHPELMYYREGEERMVAEGAFDAMLAMVSSPEGTGVTIHRTWLKDGRKAPVTSPKKLAQGLPMKGAAIRLTPIYKMIGVAEGIETALSAMAKTGIPTWACISANGLESFLPPKGVERVVVFGDNDTNFVGQAAAYKLASRLSLAGYGVEVSLPKEAGKDWADV